VLILTRKQGESVVIGNSVRVTVLESSAGSVRLGFRAPSDVSIYRDEIFNEIVEANRSAAGELQPTAERTDR
jgi:carbon storage regulator